MKVAFLAVTLALLGSALGQAPEAAPEITPTDVLNFALNLEYLEAEFYSCAAFGTPLVDDLRGGGPASTGCQKAQLGGAAQAFAEELAQDEIAHVSFLRSALGDEAVPIPQLNIGSVWAAAADAAVGATLSPPFDPYLNDLFFYHGIFTLEDVGVTAYLGAAPLIAATEFLAPAAGIAAVEAYHAGAVRALLFQQKDVVTPYNVTVAEITDAISALRDSVGGEGTDEGIVEDNGAANIVPADEDSIAFTRTPDQVIAIVTLGSGPSGGGFFPEGLNGVFGPDSAST